MPLIFDFIDRQFINNNPPNPTTSFAGKIVIVTGSNVGLGREACRKFVSLGASQVIIACRNLEKGKAAAKDIQATTSCSSDVLQVWHLDMSSYTSVISFAEKVKTELPRLDAFLANAGLVASKFKMTEDNEELITTNVVSTALLAFLVHPKLSETAKKFNTQTHLTYTGSELYVIAKLKEQTAPPGQLFAYLNDEKKANMGDRYNVSKLLGLFVIKQMAAMSPLSSSGVIINCVAPGCVSLHSPLLSPPERILTLSVQSSFCQSELTREVTQSSAVARFLIKTLARPTEVGARTLVYGAVCGPEYHGQYVPDCKITPTVGLTKGKEGAALQERFWSELRVKLEGIKPGVTTLS
jgi:NAD(P)-dependent dehydrogenase (short-subunit alcohol dehydrogenase family)